MFVSARGRIAASARRCALLGSLAVLATCGCAAAPRSGEPELGFAEPEIERLDYAPAALPAHILTCGLIRAVDPRLAVHSYLDEAPFGLSLYDFGHDPSQLNTWMAKAPGSRAFGFRRPPQAGAKSDIGRSLTDPCFGNGEEAKNVIRQVVVHRAGGQDAMRALHALLREGRSTHFLIDEDGTVYELLDPVHAAVVPEANANYAVYVALVQSPETQEYLPPLLNRAAANGGAGAFASASTPGNASDDARPAHDIPNLQQRERKTCASNGVEHPGVEPSAKQIEALRLLVDALAVDYPRLGTQLPRDEQGLPIRGYFEGSEYHLGVLAAYHTSPELSQPACLELERIFAP